MGDAAYNPITFQARIRLSIPLWPRASDKDRMETVIHETCHIIIFYKHGQFVTNHGVEWRQAMKNCGVEPTRLHSVDRTGLVRRQRWFILLGCPNQNTEGKCRMNIRHFKKVQDGAVLYCKKCGLMVNRESAVEEDHRGWNITKIVMSEAQDMNISHDRQCHHGIDGIAFNARRESVTKALENAGVKPERLL
jgi:SprT protein